MASNGCLSFQVHMYGKDVGKLKVFVKTADHLHQLYNLDGQQDDVWKRIELNVFHERWKLSGEIQFAFEVTRETGHKGDIALDDINYKATSCLKGKGPFII